MNQSTIQTEWRPVEQILLTRVAGILRQEQVEEWERDLERTSRQIPKNLTFVMLVDIRGYEVSEQERDVHQLQRIIIPRFLARHGFEVGSSGCLMYATPFQLTLIEHVALPSRTSTMSVKRWHFTTRTLDERPSVSFFISQTQKSGCAVDLPITSFQG